MSTKIVTWSIINNEMDYLPDIIDYHLSWCDQMYFLDNGSSDNSYEYLCSRANSKEVDNGYLEDGIVSPRIIVEKYHTSYTPEYNVPWEQMQNPFPEIDVRNHAIKRCKELCRPEWMIQLDGDEVFLESTRKLIEKHYNKVCISTSTINPVAPLKEHRIENRFGMKLYDPHARLWNAKYNIEFINNKNLRGKNNEVIQYHCTPSLVGWNKHLFETNGNLFVDDIVHIHLHWMYGKVQMFNKDISRQDIIKGQKLNELSYLVPKIFLQRRDDWANK